MTCPYCPHCIGASIDLETDAEAVLAAVESLFGVSRAVIFNRSRNRRVTPYKFAAWHVLHEVCGWSYPEIGRMFDRDHTTVMSGAKKADPGLVRALVIQLQGVEAA